MQNLEKIDLIRERLNVSYKEAHEALMEANGDVIAALINLENEFDGEDEVNNDDQQTSQFYREKGQELVEKIKQIIKEGNANKVIIKDKEKTLLEIPVTAGVAGLVLFPYITILGGIAALYKNYSLEVEKKQGKKESDENQTQQQYQQQENNQQYYDQNQQQQYNQEE